MNTPHPASLAGPLARDQAAGAQPDGIDQAGPVAVGQGWTGWFGARVHRRHVAGVTVWSRRKCLMKKLGCRQPTLAATVSSARAVAVILSGKVAAKSGHETAASVPRREGA